MMIDEPGHPLVERVIPDPRAKTGEILIRVRACGVCRTDLHIADGELPLHKRPVVPGHQVVGVVEEPARGVRLNAGDRVGVAWLAFACGTCTYCREGHENLCEKKLAPTIPIETAVEMHPLAAANLALDRLRSGLIRGSAVLLVDGS